jgi:hypothetical protein
MAPQVSRVQVSGFRQAGGDRADQETPGLGRAACVRIRQRRRGRGKLPKGK